MKKPTTTKRSRTNWGKIDALRDKDIDFSDIPEQDKAFFKRAALKLPEAKTAVTIRLDRQVLDWFKAKGPGYQTRINALLRAYMEAHKEIR
ncbi:MAG: BrnA antitoxin family protein [Nitrospirae bacterium]|nr:BrnA antitoxin family protein [Nitrospirota bacterium]